jgi:hypothetical protein
MSISTAIWNVARGAVVAFTTFSSMLAASIILDGIRYQQWVLVFTLVSVVQIFQLGIQSGILVIGAEATRDTESHVLRTALVVSFAASTAGFVCMTAAVFFATRIGYLEEVSLLLRADPLVAMNVYCLSIFSSFFVICYTFLVARQRSSYATLLALVGLLAQSLGFVSLALSEAVGLQAALACATLPSLTGTLIFIITQRGCPRGYSKPNFSTPQLAMRLWSHMKAQAIWVVPSLLIFGLDNFLVGRLEPSELKAYSIALTVVVIGAGTVGSFAAPFITHLSRLRLLQDDDTIVEATKLMSRRNVRLALLLVPAPVIVVIGAEILTDLDLVSDRTLAILFTLGAGHGIRLLSVTCASIAIVAQRQSLLYPAPLVEGGIKILSCFFLPSYVGVLAVPLGTTLAALGSILVMTSQLSNDGWRIIGPGTWLRFVAAPSAVIASVCFAFLLVAYR